jgi:ribosomal protein S18 acetylase RimI-like enzyme
MPTTVRPALDADIEALVALNEGVQRIHAALYPEDFKRAADHEGVRAMFAARLASPERGVAVAEIDGEPVGYLMFETQTRAETAFSPRCRRLYIHHLCVVERMRRRRVASELFQFVERRAAADGVGEIALDAWAANVGALKFFEASGFVPFNVALRKRIPPD